MKVLAMVHSLNKLDTVDIVEKKSNNDVKAVYRGLLCTAVFNPFSGYFYVDDKYGVIGKAEEVLQ